MARTGASNDRDMREVSPEVDFAGAAILTHLPGAVGKPGMH
jgi:hypothetical protein